MDFDTAADRLYGVPPSEFTATRKRLAGELPREDARRLTALRRPTVSAWAVNHLVRDGGIEPLLGLGERMREAWSSGGDVGELERERGALVDGLVRRARELAKEAGRPLNEAQSREVEDTLQAAIADPSAAEAVGAGRLEHALSHAGFGPLGAVAPSVTHRRKKAEPTEARGKRPTREEDPRVRARRLAEEARAAAERAEEAERSLAQWESGRDAAREAVAAADRRLEELRRQVKAAEAERAEAGRHEQVAQRECDRAARTAEDARRHAEEADARRRTGGSGNAVRH
ncbi:hypothetical protein AB0L00_37320 [Actinoallomurus sp. NPDC052308]|uniref:hypothetical protein n=1 Tax=Actinoallomurus sp. NPDC052308 TaxID=3155530 RepID=UPI003423D91C